MASLGGLDVAFGAQMQLVRTNVLVIETDGTTTQAMADAVHSCANNRFVSHLKPDYTAFVASGALTEGYATVLTDQVETNILKDITKVPLAGSWRDSTASNNRGMSIEAILNVGMVQINADDTATADDLFLETAGSTSGEDVGSTEFTYSEQMQSALMKDAFDDQAEPTTMNLTYSWKQPVPHLEKMQSALMVDAFDAQAEPTTMNLTAVLTDSGLLAGTAVTSGLDSITETSTLAALNDGIAGAGGVISVLAIGKIF